MGNEKQTPLMRQYWEIKGAHSDKILFFRMGDFFELFYDDAITAAPLLEITLTSRNKKSGNNTPMCGVPHHSIGTPINKLLKKGFKVAICDQIEEPKESKGIVKRAVTRILSPGMVYDPDELEGEKNNYLSAFDEKTVSFLEPTTGEFFYFTYSSMQECKKLIQVLDPVEMVVTKKQKNDILTKRKTPPKLTLSEHDILSKKTDGSESARRLLDYALTMQGERLLQTLGDLEKRVYVSRMLLPQSTIQHLELFETFQKQKKGSLYYAVNRTQTASGARLLKHWFLFPLCSKKDILERQNEIKKWLNHSRRLSELRNLLKNMYDLERRIGKISNPGCHPRDLLNLSQSLDIGVQCSQVAGTPIEDKRIHEIIFKVKNTITEDAPLSLNKGNYIQKGVSLELDRLVDLSVNSQSLIRKMEAKERAETGIPSLKIKYNNVFGYYIEVTKVHTQKVPAYYKRKQTLVNAERYTTDELSQMEREVIAAKVKRQEKELEIFNDLRVDILSLAPHILKYARMWADLDVVSSLAWLAIEQNYHCAEIVDSGEIFLKNSRHPVVEQGLEKTFVPNTLSMTLGESLLLTGPNMAGKSTLMRQVALCVLLNQIGSYIPAESARLTLFNNIYTRIGASDSLNEGLSTFMVEMTETAEILKCADERSLILLDEIGRGTSTFDGMSLAQAILEYILTEMKSTSLFATHYHDITEMKHKNLKSAHMAISEDNGELRFLYTLRNGPTNRSYGIEVAQLAGLPENVLLRAKDILQEKEKNSFSHLSSSQTQEVLVKQKQ